MKVVYDSQIFAMQEFGGISRYFCALALQMASFPTVESRIIAPLHINRYLSDLGGNIPLGLHVRRLPMTGRVITMISAELCRHFSAAIQPDVVHETYYSNRPSCSGTVPRVVSVYDMIHERFSEGFAPDDPTARNKAIAVNRADHVFCISENTRRDLLDAHQLDENRVSVTYLGYDTLPDPSLSAVDLVGTTPYLLYVGARKGYKNFEGLLSAFAKSTWLTSNFRLVCFGAGGFSHEELASIVQLGLSESQVVHLGGGDDRLAALYKGAAALVYPSMYEGFGIPPLEAMSLDCPVICSNTSSIPEVVGQAGEYFDPYSTESMLVAIENVLQSSSRRQELVELGHRRRQLFSWERCALETYDVYRRLAS